ASWPTGRMVSTGLPFASRPATGLMAPVSTLSTNGGSAETNSRSPVDPSSGPPCSGPGTADSSLARAEGAPVPPASADFFGGAFNARGESNIATAATAAITASSASTRIRLLTSTSQKICRQQLSGQQRIQPAPPAQLGNAG